MNVRKTRILSVVGARPNFMKMAPILRELARCSEFESRLVHTGQHYDEAMSEVFFRDLGIPLPDFGLNIGSASHAVQTGECMARFERVCRVTRPDLVIVAGDVNSTMACALTATKLQIRVAHIESGLRSFDRSMPEEINRIVTDSVSDLLFTTEESGNRNLRRENIAEDKIHFVGNTMIDTLVDCRAAVSARAMLPLLARLEGSSYFLATVHRPSNVDDASQLSRVIAILRLASELAPVLFVTHPRTRERLHGTANQKLVECEGGSVNQFEKGWVYLLPPLPYLDFLRLLSTSTAVLTDSGGIQEETTFLDIPCLTLRENTERPVTVEIGNNQIVGLDKEKVISSLRRVLKQDWPQASVPPLWDGRAALRIVEVLRSKERWLQIPPHLELSGADAL